MQLFIKLFYNILTNHANTAKLSIEKANLFYI